MITAEVLASVLKDYCLMHNLSYTVYPPQLKTLAAALSERAGLAGHQVPLNLETPASEADRLRPEAIIEAALILESAAVALESSIKGMNDVGDKLVMAEAAQRIRVAKSHIL